MLTNYCGRFSNDLKLKYSVATKGVFLSKKIMSKLAFYFYYLKAVTCNIEYDSLRRCLMSQSTFFSVISGYIPGLNLDLRSTESTKCLSQGHKSMSHVNK